MSFQLLKKNSLDKDRLEKAVNALSTKRSYDNPDIWKITRGEDGSGSAIIRFLDFSDGDQDLTIPVVEKYHHNFRGNSGSYYIELCPTTIGQKCPCCEKNGKMWNTNDKTLQKYVSENSKRKMTYTANILVVSDPGNKANNGKVFKFEFGVKIYEKILSAMKGNPTLKKKRIDVFNYWTGADFMLAVTGKGRDETSYAESSFEKPSVIHFEEEEDLNDEQIEELIYKKQFSLKEIISEDKFKSYNDLQERLNRAYGIDDSSETKESTTVSERKLTPTKKADDFSGYPDVKPAAAKVEVEDPAPKKTYDSSDVDAIFKELEIDI